MYVCMYVCMYHTWSGSSSGPGPGPGPALFGWTRTFGPGSGSNGQTRTGPAEFIDCFPIGQLQQKHRAVRSSSVLFVPTGLYQFSVFDFISIVQLSAEY